MSKLTATAFSFARNGWVNYEFPTYHGPNGLTFEPMHEGFAFADRKKAAKYAGAPSEQPASNLRAVPRQWAKFPQIFDPEVNSSHQRTFFRGS